MQLRKLITILIVFALIVGTTSITNAADKKQEVRSSSQVMDITIEEAQQLALQRNNRLLAFDKNIINLIKPYVGDEKYVSNIDKYSPIEEMDRLYDKLIKKQAMSVKEQGELLMIYSMYENSEYTHEKSLDGYIIKDEFPNCAVWFNMVNLKIRKEIARYQITDQVRQLFDSILYSSKQVTLFEQQVLLQEKRNKAIDLQFKSGVVSELNKAAVEVEYLSNKLQLGKQKRLLQNLQNNLKNLMGVNLSQEIKLQEYALRTEYETPEYDTYIKKALVQRNEIVIPKMELVVKANQLKQIRFYRMYATFADSLINMEINNEHESMELQSTIKEKQYEVTKDVIATYVQLKDRKSKFGIQGNKLKSADRKYNEAKVKFKAGNISETALKEAELLWMQSDIEFTNSKRQLQYTIERMDTICGIGVK